MEAYPGDPYAYMPAGGGRRFHSIEGVLPLVLLIVIAFFVLQFLGVVPCIIPVGCGGEAKVAIIGNPSPGVMTALNSKEAQQIGIRPPVQLEQSFITSSTLNDFNVIILQGEAGFDMDTRKVIRDYVDAGGKLIVVGNAGSTHPIYPNVAGWEWPSGQGIPVPAKLVGTEQGAWETAWGSELRMVDTDNPLVQGLQIMGSHLSQPAEIFHVSPEGTPIVAINTNAGYWVAVIEGSAGIGGKVIYFAYDPGYSPEILLAAINYLAGL